MQFERIYLGAGADETMAAILFRMLELGGVLVGPFAGTDGAQRLLRVRRVGEGSFDVRELMHVQFTPILPAHTVLPGQPAPFLTTASMGADNTPLAAPTPSPPPAPGLPPPVSTASPPHTPAGVPSPIPPGSPRRESPRLAQICLPPPTWSIEVHERFPSAHRAAVRTLLLSHARPDSLLANLPKEVLLDVLLPQLGYAAFRQANLFEHANARGRTNAANATTHDPTSAASDEDAAAVQTEGADEYAERSLNVSAHQSRDSGANSEEESDATRSRSDDDEDDDEEEEEPSAQLPPHVPRSTEIERRGFQRLLRCL